VRISDLKFTVQAHFTWVWNLVFPIKGRAYIENGVITQENEMAREWKKPVWTLWCRRIILKWFLMKEGWERVDSIHVAQEMDQYRDIVNTTMNLQFHEGRDGTWPAEWLLTFQKLSSRSYSISYFVPSGFNAKNCQQYCLWNEDGKSGRCRIDVLLHTPTPLTPSNKNGCCSVQLPLSLHAYLHKRRS
jgi:hypothetical protein